MVASATTSPATLATHANLPMPRSARSRRTSRSILKPGTYTGVYPFDEHSSWTRSAAQLRRKGKKNG